MVIYIYDKTFEGLLTAVFDAYSRRSFPDMLKGEGEPLPLFYDETYAVVTDEKRSNRVWNALQKKLSAPALSTLVMNWLSELPEIDLLLFRYIHKAIDAPTSIELNFSDPDVLEITKNAKKVNNERLRVVQFLRFQKAADGTFFAALKPLYNVLSLTLKHLQDRFSDQKWLIYDLKREYGYYYDLTTVTEVRFDTKENHLLTGILDENLMDRDEKLFQRLWKEYFKSITIKERLNPKLHRRNLPARFWRYLPEKQS
ncbi:MULTISPECIES: TIGR03915 family putative DNA repair protein [Sanguibacteroides]|uniref:DNA metabolism protein n=1 Tax=Sanguibacteroides justesenii TaxID=1547597 RepID=A0A0C3RFZ1_9PORP|nr:MULTISPECIES: TIGR03915 family putative DNA repair protein [Sanguibacteroides]KIO43607.1 DNA metabolism protein [Sanguibacteroides justesenii]KIO45771.1 DNA metabolism protein [Sanguibacteroides justesenii]PXZ45141.1 DNA metabolism protein [Sanguibacteroides justesenii]